MIDGQRVLQGILSLDGELEYRGFKGLVFEQRSSPCVIGMGELAV